MAFVKPVVEHWLEGEIAQWVHPMKDRSDDPSHHERTLLAWYPSNFFSGVQHVSLILAFIPWMEPSWWTHWAISCSSQCSTTGITKAMVCAILSGMVHIKNPSPCSGDSGFPLSLSKWTSTICPIPYNWIKNVLSLSLNKTFPSFLRALCSFV